jgi:hypothetical protein
MKGMIDKNENTYLSDLANMLGVTVEDILGHRRNAELVDARCMIVAILLNRPHVRQQDVALMLDISQAAVSKLLTRHGYMLSGFGDACYSHRWQTLLSELNESCCATTI